MVVPFMRSLFPYAVALMLLGVLTSCDDESGASPMEASDFCDAYVETFCEGYESCCGDSFDGQVSVGSCRSLAFDYCENWLLTSDDLGYTPTGPDLPARIVFDFDEGSAGAAIARVKSSFARCAGTPAVTFADTHFLGEPGSECLRHEDCFEGTRCEHPPRAIFGTCVFAPLEGQVCTDVCAAADLSCTDDRGERVCVGPRGEGESCSEAQCKEGLVCADNWDSVVGGGSDPRCEEQRGSSASDQFCASITLDGWSAENTGGGILLD
jgi:hypothetical protein